MEPSEYLKYTDGGERWRREMAERYGQRGGGERERRWTDMAENWRVERNAEMMEMVEIVEVVPEGGHDGYCRDGEDGGEGGEGGGGGEEGAT